MFDVTCLGILVADAIAKTVDTLPEEGKLQLVDQLELHTGGCATNTAIDLAKIGIKTAVIGKVGNDGFGNYIASELKKFNINVEGLKIEDGLNTSASVVIVSSKGERSFIHCLGSNAQFVEEDIDFSIIEKSKILFIAGALLLPKFDGEPTARVLKKAQAKDIYTVLDTAWDTTGRWMSAIGPCLPHLDLFIPSIEEAEMISGKKDVEEMADVFLSKGVKLAVIKLGKNGCFIKSKDGEKYTIPTYTDIKPVDTTGAGDSFVAGFLTGIVKGWNLYKCGKFANAVGTHCVMKVGASNGIKCLEEILDFMDKYGK
ncbi:carbohydrate kinase family protein [Petroclostridium xylanilyticum]|uniref:carbohydrate kinase family protein n=1 Tax=Petroclostridium xylanilyticum TaxID=1792311 RepID=UPI000B9908F7|nr:carbohydrate kinase family protein [Petroclostridium xylanilyticum]